MAVHLLREENKRAWLDNIQAYNAISRFGHPSYTYVLKFPDLQYEGERWLTWNQLMVPFWFPARGGYTREQYDEFYAQAPWPYDKPEHDEFLMLRGPAALFYQVLGDCAYNACHRWFRSRQCTAQPDFQSFIQVERGRHNLHVHVVISGKGLNRWMAKLAATELGDLWLHSLIQHAQCMNADGIHLEEPWSDCMDILEMARARQVSGTHHYCDVLKYKARSGHMHSCPVNAVDFITNYLLRKNLKYHIFMSAERSTPTEAYWPEVGDEKTYTDTIINGLFLPAANRKLLYKQLLSHACQPQNEPRFSGVEMSTLPEVRKQTWSSTSGTAEGTKITRKQSCMIDCMQRALTNHWLTYEQLVLGCPDLVVMLESQPGGSKLVDQMLHMAHVTLCKQHTALSYIFAQHGTPALTPDNMLVRLFNTQGYNPWQAGHWLCLHLSKQAGKQNTISFYGPASTGKTNMAKAIVQAVGLYGCVNHQNKSFVFNDCAAKLVLWWEECTMTADWVEQAKCVMGGTEFRIDRKHRESQLLMQTPLIVSTNNDIYTVTGGNTITHVHSKPLKERVVQFNFMKQLPSTFGEIGTRDVAALLHACATRFAGKLTLQGFYDTWNLDHVHNTFPLANLCASHSQDWVLHDNGLCVQCGGYLPLQRQPLEPVLEDISSEVSSPGRPDSPSEYGFYHQLSLGDSLSFSFQGSTGRSASDTEPESPERKRQRVETPEVPPASPASQRFNSAIQRVSDEYATQPDNLWDQQQCDRLLEEALSNWSEHMGIVHTPESRQGKEPPIVLHCFEDMPDLEDSGDEGDKENAQPQQKPKTTTVSEQTSPARPCSGRGLKRAYEQEEDADDPVPGTSSDSS